jgi:predicted nucleic acid-binding Zn ribbon protein
MKSEKFGAYMKTLLAIFLVGITLMTAGCYSNATKESGTDSTEKTSPTPSRSGRY